MDLGLFGDSALIDVVSIKCDNGPLSVTRIVPQSGNISVDSSQEGMVRVLDHQNFH